MLAERKFCMAKVHGKLGMDLGDEWGECVNVFADGEFEKWREEGGERGATGGWCEWCGVQGRKEKGGTRRREHKGRAAEKRRGRKRRGGERTLWKGKMMEEEGRQKGEGSMAGSETER
eukprot:226901-Rhodomonas_salina.1